MVKFLLYGYLTSARSSRAIERYCGHDVAFRFLSANLAPDYRSVSRFRLRHLRALRPRPQRSAHHPALYGATAQPIGLRLRLHFLHAAVSQNEVHANGNCQLLITRLLTFVCWHRMLLQREMAGLRS